ncbi:hypothetical protein ACJW30_02G014200 [Castanea mollissima]
MVGDGNEFTGEFTLRPLYLSDIDDFMVWATNDEVALFCKWDTCTSKEDALNFIKNKIISHLWFRAIWLNGKPIAISGARFSGYDECRGELGYALAHKYWGKGIATKAVKLVVNTIFSEWPHWERLEALAAVKSVGSQRVLERLDSEGKGKTRDIVMYSFLSTNPRS